MEKILCILLLAFLTVIWIGLGIMLNNWKKEDEEKYKNER